MTDTNTAEREALMDLIDAYAEARHVGGCHTYNAKTAEARAKVVASLAASAGREPVAWPKNAAEVREFFNSDFISAKFAAPDGSPCDEDRYYISAHDFLSAINWWADFPHLPSPPEGMAGWISVDERLPEPGQTVAFVVDSENWATFKYLHGRVLGGSYLPGQGFSVPGLSLMASLWMPLPPAPPIPASEAKEL